VAFGRSVAAAGTARDAIDRTKIALGERGSPWWTYGAPDYNRHLVKNTPYADWFAALGHLRSASPCNEVIR
jgi:hypothetical protein